MWCIYLCFLSEGLMLGMGLYGLVPWMGTFSRSLSFVSLEKESGVISYIIQTHYQCSKIKVSIVHNCLWKLKFFVAIRIQSQLNRIKKKLRTIDLKAIVTSNSSGVRFRCVHSRFRIWGFLNFVGGWCSFKLSGFGISFYIS